MKQSHKWLESALVLLVTLTAFRWGVAAAQAERGYAAIGGEHLLLLLPLFYYITRKILADWFREIRAMRWGGRK